MIKLGFWSHFIDPLRSENKLILCLAPMANVTDRAFRRIIAKYSKGALLKTVLELLPPQRTIFDNPVIWTEFVSADGLFRGGYDALINDLSFSEEERPIVAQFFTSKPNMMEKAAKLAVELGFNGVDINMGCPDKSVEKQGAGATLIKNPFLAQEIILAAKEGAGNLPVSVKTRIGYDINELETWLPNLLEAEPAVITIHARTRKEMSKVPARWEHIKKAVEIRNLIQAEKKEKTLIFGNGDVISTTDAKKKSQETGCDGVMIGRAVFGNPWLFSGYKPSVKEKLEVLVEHSKLFEELVQPKPPKGQGKSFAVMKKHFRSYVEGFGDAKNLRIRLMGTKNAKEVQDFISHYLSNRVEIL